MPQLWVPTAIWSLWRVEVCLWPSSQFEGIKEKMFFLSILLALLIFYFCLFLGMMRAISEAPGAGWLECALGLWEVSGSINSWGGHKKLCGRQTWGLLTTLISARLSKDNGSILLNTWYKSKNNITVLTKAKHFRTGSFPQKVTPISTPMIHAGICCMFKKSCSPTCYTKMKLFFIILVLKKLPYS